MLKCSFSFPDLSASGSETMEEDDDPYCVLKVKRTASFREIRKSFQMLAKQYHPDKQQSDGSSKSASVELFHKITKAYEVLSDSRLRQEFDAKSNAEQVTQQWPVSAVVDLDDMTYDDGSGSYTTNCRCGGSYVITDQDLEAAVDTVCCSTCTLSIRVLYQAIEDGD